MLYYLREWLVDYFSFFNVFGYITFRTFMAVLTGFFVSLVIYPKFIAYLKKIKIEQSIRSDGPKSHLVKAGTPVMGGLIIIFSMLLNIFLWTDFLLNSYVQLMTLVIVLFGFIGFLDDYLKVSKKNPKGLSAKHKFLMQIGFATIFMLFLYFKQDYSTALSIPFLKEFTIELGFWYVPFGVFVIVATSNALNLTDGMDGLAIVPSSVSMLLLGLIIYLVGHFNLASYLHLFYIKEAGELAIVAGATIGAALAFLWYNSYPAQIFMGDTGSLTLGAVIAAFVIITKTELLSIVFNGIFVVEAISVILQVGSFKMTGKRIFRMAPIHHHFEVKGASEPKLIVRFWIISILLAIVSIAAIKVR